jgi:hypothetical protein
MDHIGMYPYGHFEPLHIGTIFLQWKVAFDRENKAGKKFSHIETTRKNLEKALDLFWTLFTGRGVLSVKYFMVVL